MTTTHTWELIDNAVGDGPYDAQPTLASPDQRDRMALVWDLRVHMLEQEFAAYIAPLLSSDPQPSEQAHAAVQITATKWALRKIEAALDRLADGTYGICRQCTAPIPRHTLQSAPLTAKCPACHRP